MTRNCHNPMIAYGSVKVTSKAFAYDSGSVRVLCTDKHEYTDNATGEKRENLSFWNLRMSQKQWEKFSREVSPGDIIRIRTRPYNQRTMLKSDETKFSHYTTGLILLPLKSDNPNGPLFEMIVNKAKTYGEVPLKFDLQEFQEKTKKEYQQMMKDSEQRVAQIKADSAEAMEDSIEEPATQEELETA